MFRLPQGADCQEAGFLKTYFSNCPQGLFLLPVLEEFYDALPGGEEAATVVGAFQFRFLDSKLVGLLESASKAEAIAYVETEYFGGVGDQGAVVARAGKIVFGPVSGAGSINAALRLLGAKKGIAHDEFEAIGLSRFRSHEDWLDQPRYGR